MISPAGLAILTRATLNSINEDTPKSGLEKTLDTVGSVGLSFLPGGVVLGSIWKASPLPVKLATGIALTSAAFLAAYLVDKVIRPFYPGNMKNPDGIQRILDAAGIPDSTYRTPTLEGEEDTSEDTKVKMMLPIDAVEEQGIDKILEDNKDAVKALPKLEGVQIPSTSPTDLITRRTNITPIAVARPPAEAAGAPARTLPPMVVTKPPAPNKLREAVEISMTKEGYTDPKERAMMLAQFGHESVGFRSLEESFRYSSAERLTNLTRTTKSRGIEAAKEAIEAGPAAVGEFMYGNRPDLGNTEPGDGYKYRGRGIVQITGRANYAAYGKMLGIDLINNPDLAAQPDIAIRIAFAYWNNRGGLRKAAQDGDITRSTQLINGGQIGIEDRRQRYEAELPREMVIAKARETGVPVVAAASPTAAAAPVKAAVAQPVQVAAAPPSKSAPPVKVPAAFRVDPSPRVSVATATSQPSSSSTSRGAPGSVPPSDYFLTDTGVLVAVPG